MFEQMKKALSEVGRLADDRPDHIDGYMAERPTAMPDCIRVWAPCGCCLTYMSASASVLTQCDSDRDDFAWAEAEAAIGALRAAEDAEKSNGQSGSSPSPGALAIVKVEARNA